jgi:SH3 domain
MPSVLISDSEIELAEVVNEDLEKCIQEVNEIISPVAETLSSDVKEDGLQRLAVGTNVTALVDYEPQNGGELAIKAGDMIDILRAPAGEWLFGIISKTGDKGWFRSLHIAVSMPSQINSANAVFSPVEEVVALPTLEVKEEGPADMQVLEIDNGADQKKHKGWFSKKSKNDIDSKKLKKKNWLLSAGSLSKDNSFILPIAPHIIKGNRSSSFITKDVLPKALQRRL